MILVSWADSDNHTGQMGGNFIFSNATKIENTGNFYVGHYPEVYKEIRYSAGSCNGNDIGYRPWQIGMAAQTTFNNSGTVRINTVQNLNGTVDNSGEWFNEETGTLNLNAGTFTNSGSLDNTGGTLTFAGGKLVNTGSVTLGDEVNWGTGSYTSNRGILITPLKHVASVSTNYKTIYSLEMDSNAATTTYTSDVWASGASSINTGFKATATINTGSVIRITTPVSAAESNLIKAEIAKYFPNAQITFTNITTAGSDVTYEISHSFDAELINALIENGHVDWTYYKNDWNGDLNLGTSDTDADKTINGSIGFRSVVGDATVSNGLMLELVGENGVATRLVNNATVSQGSTLNLGTRSRSYSSGTIGSVESIVNNGQINVHNGTFDLPVYSGEGNITTTASAIVNWDDFRTASTAVITNAGTMNFARDTDLLNATNTGTMKFAEGLQVANSLNNDQGTVILGTGLTFGENSTWENGTGRINSDFTNLFDNGTGAEVDAINTIDLEAKAPEKISTFEETWFTKYVPASIKDAVKGHMTFDGAGNLTITNAALTTTQRDDMIKAFKEAFGDKTTVTFTGTIDGVSTNSVLNTAMVNRLDDAGHTGIVYVDRNLQGEDQAVVLGTGGLKNSVGFQGIDKAESLTLKEGKKLVLLGKKDEADYRIVDTAKPVNVTDGATLQLGSRGLAEAADYKGVIDQVTADAGKVLAAAGDYVLDLLSFSNGGEAQVDAGAKLTVKNDLSGAGNVVNAGELKAKNVALSGDLTNKTGAVTTIEGDASFTGAVRNEAAATGQDVNMKIAGLTTVSGSFTNAGHAVLANADVTSTLSNTGHLETDKLVVRGTLENHGQVDAQNTSEVHGTLTNTGRINLWNSTIASGGRLVNEGDNTSSITGKGTIQVDGLLSNVDDADFTGELLNVGAAGAGDGAVVENAASMTMQAVNLRSGRFTNTGVLTTAAGASGKGVLTVGNGAEYVSSGTDNLGSIVVEEGGYVQTYGTNSGAKPFALKSLRAAAAAETPTSARRTLTTSGYYGAGAGTIHHIGTATVNAPGEVNVEAGGLVRFGVTSTYPGGEGLTLASGAKLVNAGEVFVTRGFENAGAVTGSGTLTIGTAGTGDDNLENTGSISMGNLTFSKATVVDDLTFRNEGQIKVADTLTADGMTYRQTTAGASIEAKNGWFSNSSIVVKAGAMTHAGGLGTGNTYLLGSAGTAGYDTVKADLGTITSDSTVTVLEGATLNARDIAMTDDAKTLHLLGGRMETTLNQLFGDIKYTALDLNATDRDDLVDVEGVQIATGVGTLKESVAKGVEFGWGVVAFDDAVYSAGVVGDVLAKLDANDAPVAGHEADLQVTFNGKADQYFTVDLANKVTARPAGTQDAFGTAYAVFAGETLTNTTAGKGDGGGMLLVGTDDSFSGNVLKTNIGFSAIKGVANGTFVKGRELVLTGAAEADQTVEMLDGDLTLGEKGVVTLGSYGTDTARKGLIHNVNVEADGLMHAVNGAYTGEMMKNAGLVLVGGDGKTYAGHGTLADSGASLTFQGIETARGGDLKNFGQVTVADLTTNAAAKGGLIENFGTFKQTGTAVVSNDVVNLKTMELANYTQTEGTFTNGAEPADENDKTNESVALKAGSFVVDAMGKFVNWAKAQLTDGTIDGTVENKAGASIAYTDLAVTANAKVTNAGSITTEGYSQTGGRVANSGDLTISGAKATTIAGSLTNEGSFKVEGTEGVTLNAGADVVNQGEGEWTTAPTVTVAGGKLTQNSSKTMNMGALEIAGVGVVDVKTGRTVVGTGDLTINTTDKAQQALVNNGTVQFANTTIESGRVTGSGSFGTEGSNITVAANGALQQQSVAAGSLTNAGSVETHNLKAGQAAANSGSMTVHDRIEGNVVNSGTLAFTDGDTTDHLPGTLTLASGTVTNTGTITATEDLKVAGGHIVQNSDAAASFTNVAVESGDFTVNAGKAANLSGKLTVALADKTGAAVKNEGTLTFKTAGITSGAVTGEGAFGAADADITVGENGTIDQAVVEGKTLTNAGSVTADTVKVHESGTNTGTLTALAAEIGKLFTNAAEGVMNLADSLTGGTLTNAGSVNIAGTNGFELKGGTIENQGAFNATEKVTVKDGTIHQASSTQANFTELVMEGGQLVVDAAKKAFGTGDLTVNLADKSQTAVVNNGTVEFANTRVESGKVTGTGTFGSLVSTITTAVDGAIEQGKVLADNLVNGGSVTGNVEVNKGTNTGTITAGDLTVHGTDRFTNAAGGTLTVTGDADVKNLTNAGTASFGKGAVFTGENELTGATSVTGGVMNVADGKTSVKGLGSLTADAGSSITGTLELKSAQAQAGLTGGVTVNAGGSLVNTAGTLNTDRLTLAEGGSITSQGTTTVGKITAESKGEIVMTGGKLTIDDLTDAQNLTFTQKGGAAGDFTATRGWFENSVLNFEGGKFDASVIKNDKGEASGSLGHNIVNIGSKDLAPVVGPDSTKPSAEKVNWKDPYVVVKVDTLTSDTTVNVMKGGVLDVEHLTLTPGENDAPSLTIGTGGGMQTSLNELFNDVTTSAIDIHAKDAETGLVYIKTDVLATNRVGTVKDNIANGMQFENGSMIAFDDPDWSIDLVQSVQGSLRDAGLTSDTVGVQTHYLGDFQGLFTFDTAKKLFEEQANNGTTKPVLDPGVVFDTTTYYNVVDGESADREAQKLVIGSADAAGSNTITGSIGFKEVKNTSEVEVNSGKEFVLVGSARPDDFDWKTGYTDANKVLVDSADGGRVDVKDGTFTLGSWGLSSSTTGWVKEADLTDKGSLVTKNGEFAVWDVKNAGGTVNVTQGSILHTTNVTTSAGGKTLVAGGLTVDDTFDNRGSAFELADKGSTAIQNYLSDKDSTLKSDGSLTIEQADVLAGTNEFGKNSEFTLNSDTSLIGKIINAGKAWYKDLTIKAGSSNENSGYEQGEDLVIEAGASHVNTGTSIWNNADVEGSLTNGKPITNDVFGNDKDFDADNAAKLVIGTDGASDHLTVGKDGSLTNTGVLDASKVEHTTVAGDLKNDGQAKYQDMTVDKGASSVNRGYETGDDLVVSGTHVNTGTSIWNTADLKEGASMTSGAELKDGAPKGHEEGFTATGEMKLGTADDKHETFNVAGDLVNHGILDAADTETVKVAGTGTVTNDGRASYDDMTITSGGRSENAGFETGDQLVVESGASHVNTGVSIWNTADLAEGGSMTNGKPLGEGDKKGNESGFKSTGTLELGTDAGNETFKVAGDLDNHGVLNAGKTETVLVDKGSVRNDGQAKYDDMTLTNGGRSENSGFEQGDILTVGKDASHTNTGTSIWNNLQIEEGGSSENAKDSSLTTGTDAADEKNVISGDFKNDGTLDSTKTETTEVTGGTSTNTGNARYDDMTITQGGKSNNSGYEKGDILTVGKDGSHVNTGTSIWNNLQIEEGGSSENAKDSSLTTGTDKTDEKNVISGDFKNEGTLDSTKTETTEVTGGTSTNTGKAGYDDMTITQGGKSDNSGYEKGDQLVVDKDGTHTNSGTSIWNNIDLSGTENNSGTIETGKLTTEEGSNLNNSGTIKTDELVVNGGVIDLGGGSIDAGKTTVNGGDIIVGNHKELANENRVDYDTVIDEPVKGGFWVIGNGDLSIGKDADAYAGKVGAPDIPDAGSRITVTQKVTVGEGGSIAVGSGTWTDESNHLQLGSGDLFFGKDSVTVVDSTLLTPNMGGSIFESAVDGSKVTVESGARIVLGGLDVAGDYVITSGFQTSGNLTDGAWIGGWTTGSIFAPTDAGSGLEWEFTIGWDETKTWIHAVLEDVNNKYPDIVLPNNINDALENCRDAGSADQVLACTVIRDKNLSVAEKTRILNSVAQIGTASGAMNAAMSAANAAADSIEGRLSMRSEAFDITGAMKTFEKRKNLWVDVLGTKSESDSFAASGNMEIGWDASSYGFILGADNRFEKRDVIAGAAFSYQAGDLDSKGEDFLATKNDFSTFGVHAYAAWKPSERTNVLGSISYFRSSSEATMALPIAFKEAKADIDTNLIQVGVRGEFVWNKGNVSVIPHAGVRALISTGSDYETKLDGEKAYDSSTDGTVTWQVPVGATVRFDHLMKNGWTIRPHADVTVMSQFGDVEQKTTVKGSTGASDEVKGEFTGNFVYGATLGIQAESAKGFALGLKAGYAGGQGGQKDVNFKLEVRKQF